MSLLDAEGTALGGRIHRLIARYEVVAATVAAVVVIARLGPGLDEPAARRAEAAAPAVAPFGAAPPSSAEGPPPSAALPALSSLPAVSSAPPTDAAEVTEPNGAVSASPPGPPAFDDGGRLGEAYPFAAVPDPGAPAAVAVEDSGDVWVTTDNGEGRGADGPPRLFRFHPDGSLASSVALDGSTGLTGLALGPPGVAYALSRAPATVMRVEPASSLVATFATIPDVGPCIPVVVTADCDGSVVDQTPLPSALAFDASGNLFVADAAQAAIWRVAAGSGEVSQWLVEPNWANPSRPSGPAGLAFDGQGNLVIAVQSLLTEDVGVVFLQEVTAEGGPGPRHELARSDAGARPSGVALSRAGRIYLPLAGTGRVLIFAPDGELVATTPDAGQSALATPVGVAFRGTSLLVANQSPGDLASAGVTRLPTGEPGGVVRRGP